MQTGAFTEFEHFGRHGVGGSIVAMSGGPGARCHGWRRRSFGYGYPGDRRARSVRSQPEEFLQVRQAARRVGANTGVSASRMDFEDFFQNGGIACHIVGADGTILNANQAELNLLGYPPEDYIGRRIVGFHVDRSVIEDILARLKSGERLAGYPARLRARDGSVRHVEITSSGRFRDGRFVNTRCFTVDVTELARAREGLRRKGEEMRQLLDELNHRVKNNMQMLHGLLQSAMREVSSQEAREVIRNANQRVNAMAAAQQLLYSDSNPRSFSIGGFLHAVCASARHAIPRDVSLYLESDEGRLSNDVSMPLALILNELLTNAARHGAGAGRLADIRVSLRRCDDEAVLTVADRGRGFDPEATTLRASGLGLVRGLARQLGGAFAVECGGGTRCMVRFSAARADS